MSTVKTTLQADWAPALEQLARQAAIALVAVYAAGWWLGRQVHDLNNWLAGKRPPAPEPTNTLLLDVRALRNAGLTHREIGQELKISQGRVRQLLRTEK